MLDFLNLEAFNRAVIIAIKLTVRSSLPTSINCFRKYSVTAWDQAAAGKTRHILYNRLYVIVLGKSHVNHIIFAYLNASLDWSIKLREEQSGTDF